MKFMPILLTDSLVVKKGMKNATKSLNPIGRKFNILIYYQHLMILKYLDSEAI
jgi:hypothetical protein